MTQAGSLAIVISALVSAAVAGAPAAGAVVGGPGSVRPAFSSEDGSALAAVSCRSATLCFAVGEYWNAHKMGLVPLAERWSGKSWKPLPMPDPRGATETFLDGVSCNPGTACFAVGYHFGASVIRPVAEQWNGRHWVIRAVPHIGTLHGVSCKSVTFCLAVGDYKNGPVFKELAATWNGRGWTIQRTPDPGAQGTLLNWVACVSATWCSAVGEQDPSATTEVPLAQVWNGHRWMAHSPPVPAGGSFGQLAGEACESRSSCYAVGSFVSSTGESVALVEHWNGRHWTVQNTPSVTGATQTSLNSVACTSATSCQAVGFSNDGTQNLTLAEHWNGDAWTVEQTPNASAGKDSFLSGVRCPAKKTCVAIGSYFNTSRDADQTLAEVWNGKQWTIEFPANPSNSAPVSGGAPGDRVGPAPGTLATAGSRSGSGSPLGWFADPTMRLGPE
jgi:hypothetical protein